MRDFDTHDIFENYKTHYGYEVIETIERVLSNYFFETNTDGSINRDCPKCNNGLLNLN